MKRLALISDGKIHVLGSIPDKDCDDLISHFRNISDFDSHVNRLRLVTKPYDSIQQNLSLETINNYDLARAILEFVNAFRTFLNHCETHLKRSYGDTSRQYQAFRNATKKAYDNSFAYRFFYEFRNYIQHCEFPTISMTSELGDGNAAIHHLLLDRNELLSKFNWKVIVKKDIESQPSKIDLLSILDNVISDIKDIHEVMVNGEDLQSILNSSKAILEYKQYQTDNKHLALVEYISWHEDQIPERMNITYFPFKLADHIVQNVK